MVTKTEYTIQQVAEITGLSGHTLRYYERIGLLSSVDRAANGHRRYTDDTIREMQHYAELRRQGQSTLAERQAMLKCHHAVVTEQLRLLQEYLMVIEYKIALYQKLQEEQQHESTSVGS